MNLLLPTDNCPVCLSGPFPPVRTTSDRESMVGHYRCGECGRKWTCAWLLESLREAA